MSAKLSRPVRGGGHAQETITTHTKKETTEIECVLNHSVQLQPQDHSARSPCVRLWNKSYIRIGTFVLPAEPLHAQVGNDIQRVVEAVGEIRHADQ